MKKSETPRTDMVTAEQTYDCADGREWTFRAPSFFAALAKELERETIALAAQVRELREENDELRRARDEYRDQRDDANEALATARELVRNAYKEGIVRGSAPFSTIFADEALEKCWVLSDSIRALKPTTEAGGGEKPCSG